MVSAPPTLVAHISLLSAELVDCKLDYLPLFDVSCRHLLHVTSVTSCVLLAQADIVTLMRAHTKKRVAAIGDGGNDVSMIQVHLLCYHTSSCFNLHLIDVRCCDASRFISHLCTDIDAKLPHSQKADVGIGIVGKEGKQASLAADFSILQFSFVTRLLLWHGRNSYKRSARYAVFV